MHFTVVGRGLLRFERKLAGRPRLLFNYLPLFHHCVLNFFPLLPGERKKIYETRTILSNGYLGSPNDEERSEMRYVMRIAEFSESSNL